MSLAEYHTCELRLLRRLLYKHKNQHRKGNYYHKLQEVRRVCQQVAELLDGTTANTMNEKRQNTAEQSDTRYMCTSIIHAQHIILKASPIFVGLLAQTYFMSFALAALAILARLYSLQRTRLIEELECALATHTIPCLARSLHQAMRLEDAKEKQWIERFDGADLFAAIEGAMEEEPDLAHTTVLHSKLVTKHSVAIAIDSEGDSDEDMDLERTITSRTAVVPPQLAFFTTPVAGKNLKATNPSTVATPKVVKAAQSAVTPAKPPITATTPKSRPPLPSPPPSTAFQTPVKPVVPSRKSIVEMDDESADEGEETEEAHGRADSDVDMVSEEDGSGEEERMEEEESSEEELHMLTPSNKLSHPAKTQLNNHQLQSRGISTIKTKGALTTSILASQKTPPQPVRPDQPKSSPVPLVAGSLKRKQPPTTHTQDEDEEEEEELDRRTSSTKAVPNNSLTAATVKTIVTRPSTALTKSPSPCALEPLQKKQRLESPIVGASKTVAPVRNVSSNAAPSVQSHESPSPFDLLSRGLMKPAAPATGLSSVKSTSVNLKQKLLQQQSKSKLVKKKKLPKDELDEMDDIFA